MEGGKKNHACLGKGDVSGRTSPTGWMWTLRVEIHGTDTVEGVRVCLGLSCLSGRGDVIP